MECERTMKRLDYLNWDAYFMGIALLSAERSKDPSTSVGACIVDEDNNFIKGFVLFHLLKNNSYLSIYTICVDENNRGQHIASNMVNFIRKKY